MKLLDAAGHAIADPWITLADDAALPGEASCIVSLARLKAEGEALAGRNAPLGVTLPSDARPEEIADRLGRLALIAIEFPKFRDGRGFTIARTLRERYGYTGEIRAVGTILPDQYVFLIRCGVTSVALPDDAPLETWRKALGQFTITYQPGVTDDPPVSLLRRRLSLDTPRR